MDHTPDVPHSPAPQAAIMQMLTGGWITKLLSEVTRLGVPDALHRKGARTAAELTSVDSVAAQPQALHRALRACAALGIFTEDTSGRFGATPLSTLLTREEVRSLKRLAEFQGGLLWKIWTGLPEALQTGDAQARAQLGMEFFEYLGSHPDAMEEFGEAMTANSVHVNDALLAHYDFSGIRRLADVGGGFGHLVISALERYPDLRGVLLDLPEVIAAAPQQRLVADPSVLARLEYMAGDMFRDVPPADAYVLKMIIHDWDDERCVALLRNCGARLTSGGRVLCVDAVLPPLGDTTDAPGKLLDVNMMLVLKGKERTRAEWEALYREAGLELHDVIPIPDTFNTCVVEGRTRNS